MQVSIKSAAAIAAVLAIAAGPAQASVAVSAAASIYDAGNVSPVIGSSLPSAISILAGTSFLQFSNVTGSDTCAASTSGCITINGGGNFNDADGNGSAVTSSNSTGTSSISGIIAPGAGYLVGLFVAAGGPSGAAPFAPNFLPGGVGFASLAPQLDQTFFIGDGLTGDGTGSVQDFYVPTGAATLYLGISDACSYSGVPSCYSDNSGTFTVTVSATAAGPSVPEPQSWALLAGAVALLSLRRRRRG